MLDNAVEAYFANHARIHRISDRVRQLRRMNPDERQAYLHQMKKQNRKRNRAFCKKYPEKCR